MYSLRGKLYYAICEIWGKILLFIQNTAHYSIKMWLSERQRNLMSLVCAPPVYFSFLHEAESKEKQGVWDHMPELTPLCPLQSRLQHIYHGQPYARVDFIPQSGILNLASCMARHRHGASNVNLPLCECFRDICVILHNGTFYFI